MPLLLAHGFSFDIPWYVTLVVGLVAAFVATGHVALLLRGVRRGAPPRRMGAAVSSGLALAGTGPLLLFPPLLLLAGEGDDLSLVAFLAAALAVLLLLTGFLGSLAGWAWGGLLERPGPPHGERLHVALGGVAAGLILGSAAHLLGVPALLQGVPGMLVSPGLAVWVSALGAALLAAAGLRARVRLATRES